MRVPDLIRKQAERNASACAYVYENERFTYQQIDAGAQRCASVLADKGVKAGQIVAVAVEDTSSFILSLLSIMKLGAAYYSMDPRRIPDLSPSLMKELNVSCLLVEPKVYAEAEAMGVQIPIIQLDAVWQQANALQKVAIPDANIPPRDTARVFSIQDKAYAYASYDDMQQYYEGLSHHLNADSSTAHVLVFEHVSNEIASDLLFASMLKGTEVWMVRDWTDQHASLLPDSVKKRHLLLHKSKWLQVMDSGLCRFDSFERVSVLGPPLLNKQLSRWQELTSFASIDHYFIPHHSNKIAAHRSISANRLYAEQHSIELIPIGRPMPDKGYAIVDRSMQETPAGLRGRLALPADITFAESRGASAITGGWFLTQATAIPLPDQSVYMQNYTGRYFTHGGQHIDLRIIEEAVQCQEHIEAVRIVLEKQWNAEAKAHAMIGFVKFKPECALTARELMADLKSRLPLFALPAYWLPVEHLSFDELGEWEMDRLHAIYRSKLEETDSVQSEHSVTLLIETLEEMLQVSHLDAEDNVFEYGIDSIKMLQLRSKLRKQGYAVEVEDMFRYPVISQLAGRLQPISREEPTHVAISENTVIDVETDLDKAEEMLDKENHIQRIYSLTPMQELVLSQNIVSSGTGLDVNIIRCRILGGLDVDRLKHAWEQVIHRHDILRTAFAWKRLKNPFQIVYRTVELPWQFVDLQEQSEESQQQSIYAKQNELLQAGFPVAQAPLMKIVLMATRSDCHELMWAFQTSLMDGWSTNVIMRDLVEIYDRLRVDPKAELQESTPYLAYVQVVKKQDSVKAKQFWQQMFDQYEPNDNSYSGKGALENPDNLFALAEQSTFLDSDGTERLRQLSRSARLTMSTFFQAAWARYLSERENSNDIICGIVSSGRDGDIPEMEQMAGLFVNILPCRMQGGLERPTLQWLTYMQQQQVDMNKYGQHPIHQIAKWNKLPISHMDQVIHEKTLVYLHYPTDQEENYQLDELQMTNFQNVDQIRVPLRLYFTLEEERIRFYMQYNQHAYAEDYIREMLAKVKANLVEIANMVDGTTDRKELYHGQIS